MGFNSTIISKKKKCSVCGNIDYIFSRGKCKQCSVISSTQKRLTKHEEVDDAESLQNLIEDADVVYSRYIRLLYSDNKGLVHCFTCPKILPIAQIQCGHYVSRSNMILRYSDDNCRPQCPSCNSRHEIDEIPFTVMLEKENPGIAALLKNKSREVYKYTKDELKSLISELRWKVKVLEKKLKP